MSYPVFIPCRDRLTTLVDLIGWLESVDNAEIYLIDNASTWGPLLDFYETTDHSVIRTGGNHGHKVGWTKRIIGEQAKGRRFIYTDPDLIPVDDCPADAIAQMADVLNTNRWAVKCGFALKIDDLPEWSKPAHDWELPYWSRWDAHVEAWRAPIDTTFALYDARQVYRHTYQPAYRLPKPYLMRHLPWYSDPHALSEEEAYYVGHADPTISNWTRDVLAS